MIKCLVPGVRQYGSGGFGSGPGDLAGGGSGTGPSPGLGVGRYYAYAQAFVPSVKYAEIRLSVFLGRIE